MERLVQLPATGIPESGSYVDVSLKEAKNGFKIWSSYIVYILYSVKILHSHRSRHHAIT